MGLVLKIYANGLNKNANKANAPIVRGHRTFICISRKHCFYRRRHWIWCHFCCFARNLKIQLSQQQHQVETILRKCSREIDYYLKAPSFRQLILRGALRQYELKNFFGEQAKYQWKCWMGNRKYIGSHRQRQRIGVIDALYTTSVEIVNSNISQEIPFRSIFVPNSIPNGFSSESHRL